MHNWNKFYTRWIKMPRQSRLLKPLPRVLIHCQVRSPRLSVQNIESSPTSINKPTFSPNKYFSRPNRNNPTNNLAAMPNYPTSKYLQQSHLSISLRVVTLYQWLTSMSPLKFLLWTIKNFQSKFNPTIKRVPTLNHQIYRLYLNWNFENNSHQKFDLAMVQWTKMN